MKRRIELLLIVVTVILISNRGTGYADESKTVYMEGRLARVTLIEKGKPEILRKGERNWLPLCVGDLVKEGDRIRTGVNCRLEILLPDSSIVRFAEDTSFEIHSEKYSIETKTRNIRVHLFVGRIWARVAKLFGAKKGGFLLSSPTAVAGVRGTIYRMNVDKDTTTTVKVYRGEVFVRSPKRGTEERHAISKPKRIPGPHPVTMQEWTYIVGAMQQIVVLPDGAVRKPFRFTLAEDMNDWVKWNQMRDKQQVQ
nr:hypothetical protein [Desulfobacterales bacterium]